MSDSEEERAQVQYNLIDTFQSPLSDTGYLPCGTLVALAHFSPRPQPTTDHLAFMSASVNQVASGSRSRPQARKKVNDDAAYFGPPSGSGVTGTKRQATDKADGDLNRAKRKRVETTHSTMTNGKKDAPDPDKQPVRSYCRG